MILQVSVIGIIAIGVTQVIISGGIDLSSGSVVGATAMISMSLAQTATERAVYPGLTDLPVLVPVAVGLLVGLAGILVAARALTAQSGMGVMYELDAIAMTVIGGVSLAGGRGSIPGTMIGMVIFGVIISGFTLLRLGAHYQEMIKGEIIVAAVVADVHRQKKRVRKS